MPIPSRDNIKIGELYEHDRRHRRYRVMCFEKIRMTDGTWIDGLSYSRYGDERGRYARSVESFRKNFTEVR